MAKPCEHAGEMEDVTPSSEGCEACLAVGDTWLHLRLCMTCGTVGCCDGSKNRHARAHSAETSHPIIQSFEPGEDWWWCYVDDIGFRMPDRPSHSYAAS